VLGLLSSAPAQTANIHYVYDSLNRLVGVVDRQGSVGVYVYDPVGNLLRIDRVDASSTVESALALLSGAGDPLFFELRPRYPALPDDGQNRADR